MPRWPGEKEQDSGVNNPLFRSVPSVLQSIENALSSQDQELTDGSHDSADAPFGEIGDINMHSFYLADNG